MPENELLKRRQTPTFFQLVSVSASTVVHQLVVPLSPSFYSQIFQKGLQIDFAVPWSGVTGPLGRAWRKKKYINLLSGQSRFH